MTRIAACLFVMLLAGHAEAAADPANGAALARKWCTGCHALTPDTAMSDANLSFAQIAERRGGQPDFLRTFLMKPHAPMPNFSLSRREIDDLTAYIVGLKTSAATP